MITVTSNIKKIQSDFNNMGKKLRPNTNAVIKTTAAKAKELAERYCPQDTGALFDSIYVTVGDNNFELGATARHAIFNEYGSYNIEVGTPDSPKAGRYSGQRPFIRPAIITATRYFDQYFDRRWSRIVHG